MTTSPLKVTRILKIKGLPKRNHWFDLFCVPAFRVFWGIIFRFKPFCSENRTAPTLGEASVVQPGPWFRRWNAFRWGSWTSLLGGSVFLENQQASLYFKTVIHESETRKDEGLLLKHVGGGRRTRGVYLSAESSLLFWMITTIYPGFKAVKHFSRFNSLLFGNNLLLCPKLAAP